jgi:hypothetical protein
MANIPDVKVIERKLIAVVWTEEEKRPGMVTYGCSWTVYNLDGKRITWGYSKGMKGSGCGSRLTAMENATRAARRCLKRGEA